MNESYCRLCAELMSDEKLLNLQDDCEKRQTILGKLSKINVQVNFDDHLPKTVCITCIQHLDISYEFVETVDKAQKYLQNVVLKNESAVESKGLQELSDSDSYPHASDSVQIEIENDKNTSKTLIIVTDATDISMNEERYWLDYSWMCSYCETLFKTVEELQIHSMEVHSRCNAYKCVDCGRRRHDLKGFIKHICTHNESLKLSCYICFATYQCIYDLQIHIYKHQTSKFVCVGCNTCFDSKDSLETHKNMFYSLIRINKLQTECRGLCSICNKKVSNLSGHMLMHKNRSCNYICDKCGKTFLTKHALNLHYMTHSEERPYECKICKKSFTSKYYLRDHVILHNDVKPFSCDQCDRSYHSVKYLNAHKKVHTDMLYECDKCCKRFKLKKMLKSHLKLHSGIMPYTCEPCQWSFKNYTNYFKHMLGRHNTDIRKKKFYSMDEATLEWKEELLRKRQTRKANNDSNR